MRLPTPIDVYFKAENSGDVEAFAECFTPSAKVRDEGRIHHGLSAIREWKAETKKKYHHTAEPLRVLERGGRTIVTVRLTGTFPGSPITLDFAFTLQEGKIASLEIGP